MSVLTPRGSGQPENGESSVRERPRRQRELSLPELVEMTHVIGKLEATDDTIRVVDHCLLKIAAVENKLLDCLRKHEAVVTSGAMQESADDESDVGSSVNVEVNVEEQPTKLYPRSSTASSNAMHDSDQPYEVKVPKKYIKQFLKKELQEAGACMALPIVILMFACFCLGTVGSTSHFKTEQLHSQDYAISFDIEENANFAFAGSIPFEIGRMGWKNIYDVNSVADFWSWLNLGLLPIFFPAARSWDTSESRSNVAAQCESFKSSLEVASWPESVLTNTKTMTNIHGRILQPNGTVCPEGLDSPERPTDYYGDEQVAAYLFHQEAIGGLRLRQEFTPQKPCSDSTEKFRGRLFSGHCLDVGPYKLKPEISYLLQGDKNLVDHPDGRTVYFPTRRSLSEMRNVTRELENEVWFSPYTQKIDLLYTTYNPNYDSVTATNIFFVLNRAGHIFKVVEPMTFVLEAYPHWSNYVFDIVWLLCIIKLGAGEVMDAAEYWNEFGPLKGTFKYLRISNLIDWLNVIYAIVIVVMWIVQLSAIGSLKGMLRTAHPSMPGSFSTQSGLVSYFDEIDYICTNYSLLRRILAFYPFVVISGFLKPFNGQPRLGIMTRTLAVATVDIIHFFFVFAIVFCIYSIMGMMLFGQELVEFATFSRALTATFHTLLGELPGQETMSDNEYPLARAGRLEAALWVWSFCWIINLTMLNMLLAIVMDTYAAVRSDMPEDAETLMSQAFEIFSRAWYQFKYGYIPLDKVLEAMDPTALDDGPDSDDEEMFDAQKLIKECDDIRGLELPMEQATDVIEKSLGMERDALKGGGTTSEMAMLVTTMEEDMKALLQIIEANSHLIKAASDPYGKPAEDEEKEKEEEESQTVMI